MVHKSVLCVPLLDHNIDPVARRVRGLRGIKPPPSISPEYNAPIGDVQHSDFAGVVSDYPENLALDADEQAGYHTDAINLLAESRMRIAGGTCDDTCLAELIARKLQFLFPIRGDSAMYSLVVHTTVRYPTSVSDFTVDINGPDATEQRLIPSVVLGVQVGSKSPTSVEMNTIAAAAKQWALLYHWWRDKQFYGRYPGIVPIIPNGYAQAIKWTFKSTVCETTYIALDGIQGTSNAYCAIREPFYAVIDGEGTVADSLQGFYAWTELIDANGDLNVSPTSRKGYVANVNGSYVTFNPARDEAGKVAVPVGLVVRLIPGVPYLDALTGVVFDHYLFNTTDLVQIVRLQNPLIYNSFGHVGGIIQRWDPDIKQFVDSEEIWCVVLD